MNLTNYLMLRDFSTSQLIPVVVRANAEANDIDRMPESEIIGHMRFLLFTNNSWDY